MLRQNNILQCFSAPPYLNLYIIYCSTLCFSVHSRLSLPLFLPSFRSEPDLKKTAFLKATVSHSLAHSCSFDTPLNTSLRHSLFLLPLQLARLRLHSSKTFLYIYQTTRSHKSESYLFSRLYNVSTSSCAHLTII
jgi:hypothetical protein